jgi:NadR type nicotinamide-nucleotide adenylyltransferase
MGLDCEAWYGGSYGPGPWDDPGPVAPPPRAEGRAGAPVFDWARPQWDAIFGKGPRVPGDALVLGRFLPAHRGHAVLIARAAAHVQGTVHVGIACTTADFIAPRDRREAVQKLFPFGNGRALEVSDVGRGPAGEGDAFWDPWLAWFRADPKLAACRTLVAGDPNARRFAELLGLSFLLVDRSELPLSASMIRADPWKHWNDIAPDLRSYFTRTVALVGPEGAGKSTLAKALGAHYRTSLATEYLPRWCQAMGVEVSSAQQLTVAVHGGQLRSIQLARRIAWGFCFADTEEVSLSLWSERLHGVRGWWEAEAEAPALTLLLEDAAPWLGRKDRDEPPQRLAFFDALRREWSARGWPFVVVGGPREARLGQAIAAIDAWVKERPAAVR